MAGMGNVKTERLDDLGIVFVVNGKVFVHILRIELFLLPECFYIIDAREDILPCHIGQVTVLFKNCFHDLFRGVIGKQLDDIIRHVVHGMYGAAAGIQNDVIAVELVLMYHNYPLLNKHGEGIGSFP